MRNRVRYEKRHGIGELTEFATYRRSLRCFVNSARLRFSLAGSYVFFKALCPKHTHLVGALVCLHTRVCLR
jgi:hypothetical protein